jgi:hypothetical protein
MLALYRLARDAAHTLISSLTFALFNRPLPYHSPEIEQEIDSRLARIAERQQIAWLGGAVSIHPPSEALESGPLSRRSV